MGPSHPQNSDRPLVDPEALAHVFDAFGRGVVDVKPRLLFTECERRFPDPIPLHLFLPPSGIGSITLIEAAVMTALVNLIQPRGIFEFGTFLGYSTALFLRNSPASSPVCSIDLGAAANALDLASGLVEADVRQDAQKNDDFLRSRQGVLGPTYLRNLPPHEAGRLTLLQGDSRALDVSARNLRGRFGLVFVDGGHDEETVRSDTEKAYELIDGDGLILWHDFRSAIHGDVTTYLDRLSSHILVVSVTNTLLAFTAVGNTRTRLISRAAPR